MPGRSFVVLRSEPCSRLEGWAACPQYAARPARQRSALPQDEKSGMADQRGRTAPNGVSGGEKQDESGRMVIPERGEKPQSPALLQGTERKANYLEFARSAGAISAALAGYGIGKGDRVALFAANSTRYLEALYGIWWRGGAAVPINAKLHEKEAAWMVENSGAEFVFADKKTAELVAPYLPEGVGLVSLDSPEFGAMCQAAPHTTPEPLDPADLAWLFYTSGTTGRPKGVMLTCGNLASMALSYFVDVDDVKPQDAILYAAPMSMVPGSTISCT